MDGARHHYKQLALHLHPDKGGSATHFVHLNVLYDLLQSADKRTAAAQAEMLAARGSAQQAFAEAANARNDLNANINTFNARVAAQTLAVQAQWARWHHEQLAAAGAEAARRHASELDSARHRILFVERQLRRSQAGEKNCTKELEQLKRAKRKRDDAAKHEDDPLSEYFAESTLEREAKRCKEWEATLSVERRSQRNLASEWRAGALYIFPPASCHHPPIKKTADHRQTALNKNGLQN